MTLLGLFALFCLPLHVRSLLQLWVLRKLEVGLRDRLRSVAGILSTDCLAEKLVLYGCGIRYTTSCSLWAAFKRGRSGLRRRVILSVIITSLFLRPLSSTETGPSVSIVFYQATLSETLIPWTMTEVNSAYRCLAQLTIVHLKQIGKKTYYYVFYYSCLAVFSRLA